MTNIPNLIRQYAREELMGIYTVSMAIVKSVDHEQRRVDVALMRDTEIIIDNVPVATTYAHGEGYGEVIPVESGMEGLILHTKEPTDNLITQAGHVDIGEIQSAFRVRDAFFFPTYWNDDDETPSEKFDYDEGDYLFAHPSGKLIWIKDDGSVVIEDEESEQGIKLDGESGGFKLLDEGGYGIVSDGSGNFKWHHSDVDFVTGSTEL